MKKSTVLLAALLSLGAFAVASAQEKPAPAAVSSGADKDYQAYQDLAKRQPTKPVAEMSNRDKMEFTEALAQDRRTAALAFIEKYPADPRRWTIVSALTPTSPRFITAYGEPDARGTPATTIDEPAAAAWKAKVAELKAAMAKATDVPLDIQEAAGWNEFAAAFRATTTAKNKGEPFDYAPFRARFDAHVAKYGTLTDAMNRRADDYLGALKSVMGAPVADKEWAYLEQGAHAGLKAHVPEVRAKAAQIAARESDLKSKPLEIAFTAVDGRAVDLKNLRGKVVLIDFWATWCGPCIAELPNIKKVYADYHAKGFEIVGISLENGRLLPTDTPEQTNEKMAKAAKILTDFTAKENMPWPQHFDGKYWKNDISTRFAINSIPAMFLLDQEGKVVSTNARGEQLEKEVKRLLKL